MPAKMLRKITPKTVCDERGIDLLNLPRPVESQTLYDLFGVISRTKVGQTDKGPWLQFLGRFTAVTPDGEEFTSGRTHIPVLEDMIYSALEEAKAGGGAVTVEVALRISIKPAPKDKPSATGYEYDVQRLVEPTAGADDPIARLRAEAAKALPAPGKETGGKTHSGSKRR